MLGIASPDHREATLVTTGSRLLVHEPELRVPDLLGIGGVGRLLVLWRHRFAVDLACCWPTLFLPDPCAGSLGTIRTEATAFAFTFSNANSMASSTNSSSSSFVCTVRYRIPFRFLTEAVQRVSWKISLISSSSRVPNQSNSISPLNPGSAPGPRRRLKQPSITADQPACTDTNG